MRKLQAKQAYLKVEFFEHFVCFLFFITVARKNFVCTKIYLSFIANIVSLHYFLDLGCGSLFHNINQGRRQSLYYQVRLTYYSRKASQLITKKRVHLQLAIQNPGAK